MKVSSFYKCSGKFCITSEPDRDFTTEEEMLEWAFANGYTELYDAGLEDD